jgi:hypothetical protein
MTRGFSPLPPQAWKESIEISVGMQRSANPEAETVRRIQELNKQAYDLRDHASRMPDGLIQSAYPQFRQP